MSKYYTWNEQKNELLKKVRNVSFEEVEVAINMGKLLDEYSHPDQEKYPGQKIYVVEIEKYAYLIPYVEDEEKIFLKTIYPSRRATRKYIK